MRIALGIHVDASDVRSSLVDTDLPSLGPISSRVTDIAAVPGGVGDAVVTALGIMRVHSMQNGLEISAVGVACESSVQCDMVRSAIEAGGETGPVQVVDIFDLRMGEAFDPDVAVAVLAVEFPAPAGVETPEKAAAQRRTGIASLPVVSFAVGVLALLGATTVWAMTANGGDTPPGDTPMVSNVEVVVPAAPTKTPGVRSTAAAVPREFETPGTLPSSAILPPPVPVVPASIAPSSTDPVLPATTTAVTVPPVTLPPASTVLPPPSSSTTTTATTTATSSAASESSEPEPQPEPEPVPEDSEE